MGNTKFSLRLQQAMELRNLKSSQIESMSEKLLMEGRIKKAIKMPLITDYLKGRYEAKQDNIRTLALILDVDDRWLMGDNVPMEREVPFSAIYYFSRDNEKRILDTSIRFAIQNSLNKDDISNNQDIRLLLDKLDTLDINIAIEFVQYFSNKYRGMEEFSLENAITALEYSRDSHAEPKIEDMYMHLAKEAQDLKLEQEDIDYILNFYKRNKK
ncbi:MAG: hypothetical protein HFJ52_00330 [Clostridia bacterium]|jgi:hypothetical protein|nr:hypothetical protein [Clostridia bacterium]